MAVSIYILGFVFLLFVFLYPIKNNVPTKRLRSLYLIFFAIGILQIFLILLLYFLSKNTFLSVELATIIGVCGLAVIIEEVTKFKTIPRAGNRAPFFTIAWVIGGFESFGHYLSLMSRKILGETIAVNGSIEAFKNVFELFLTRTPSVLMHLLTCYIIWVFLRSNHRPWLGVAIAIAIHAAFNFWAIKGGVRELVKFN